MPLSWGTGRTPFFQRGASNSKSSVWLLAWCVTTCIPTVNRSPLIDRLRELPVHVERSITEGVCRGGGAVLGQMVYHFDEINATIIAEGYAVGQSDEELDTIEEHVHPLPLVDCELIRH